MLLQRRADQPWHTLTRLDYAREMRRWIVRGVLIGVGLCGAAGACGDVETPPASATADAGRDGAVVPSPTTIAGFDSAPPPEGIDTTGLLGPPLLVADVKTSVDGPSWRVADQALYFAVPKEAPTLRRLFADGRVEAVSFDAGPPGPYGTANGGGTSLFLTEPNAITSIDLTDAGLVTLARKSATFELLGDIAAQPRPDASSLAFFVDTAGPRAYRFDPASGELARLYDSDAGQRATGIAVGRNDLDQRVVYVALGTGATGEVVVVTDEDAGGGFVDRPRQIFLPGTSPNGIAVDEQGKMYVAWAQGIDVYESAAQGGQRIGESPGIRFYAPPTSLAFGGADRTKLYVTTATGKIYALQTQVVGVLR